MRQHKCGSIPARSLIRAASAATHRDRELHTDTLVHARRHGHTRTHTPGTNAQRSRPARLLSPARPSSSPCFADQGLRAPSRAPPGPRGLAPGSPHPRLSDERTFSPCGPDSCSGHRHTALDSATQSPLVWVSLPARRTAEPEEGCSQLARPSHPASQGSGTGRESAGCKDAASSKPCLPSSRPGARDGGRRCRSGLHCPPGLPQLPPSAPGPNPGAGWQHGTAAGSETAGRSDGGCLHTPLLQDAVGERLCFQQQQIDKTPLHEPNSERACVRKARVPSRPHTDLSRRRHRVPERKSIHKEDNSS